MGRSQEPPQTSEHPEVLIIFILFTYLVLAGREEGPLTRLACAFFSPAWRTAELLSSRALPGFESQRDESSSNAAE